MRSTTSKTDHRFDLPALPVSVVSLDGQVVGTDQPSWLLRSSADGGKLLALKWSRLDDSAILTERARYLVKLFLADKISRKKARTIENDFRMFFRFQGWLQSIHRVSFEWSDLTEGIAQQRSHCSYRYHGSQRCPARLRPGGDVQATLEAAARRLSIRQQQEVVRENVAPFDFKEGTHPVSAKISPRRNGKKDYTEKQGQYLAKHARHLATDYYRLNPSAAGSSWFQVRHPARDHKQRSLRSKAWLTNSLRVAGVRTMPTLWAGCLREVDTR